MDKGAIFVQHTVICIYELILGTINFDKMLNIKSAEKQVSGCRVAFVSVKNHLSYYHQLAFTGRQVGRD
jgi:hypothetical protein